MFYRQNRPKINNYMNFRNNRYNIMNSNNTRNITSPILGKAISVPKATGLFKSMLPAASSGTSKLGLTGILGGISKTITTVNQAMPIINQVKPLFGNVKSVFNVFKNLRNNNLNNNIDNEIETNINNIDDNNEVIDVKTTKSSENLQENYQFTPNSPFFNYK